MFNLAPMKFEAFRVEEETVKAVETIIKLRRSRGGKSSFYREAVEEKVEREKKKLQSLAKLMNG